MMAPNVKLARLSGFSSVKMPDFKKYLTRAHILTGVGILISAVLLVAFLRSGNILGIVVTTLITGGVTFAGYSAKAPEKEVKGKSLAKKSNVAATMAPKTLGLLFVGFVAFVGSSLVVGLWFTLAIGAVIAAWCGLAYYKKGNVFSYVRTEWKTIRHAFALVLIPIIRFQWLPVRFHLVGSTKHFLLGWLPFCKTAGLLIPEVGIPFTTRWLRISAMKIELIDILMIGYSLWSYADIRAAAGSGFGLTLQYYVMAIAQVVAVLSVMVLLNKDGSRSRMLLYVAFGAFGLYAEVGNASIFALDKGWLNPQYIVLGGVQGDVVAFICLYAILHELVVQPIYNVILPYVSTPTKRITDTLEMLVVAEPKPVAKPVVAPAPVVKKALEPKADQQTKQVSIVPKVNADMITMDNADHRNMLSVIKKVVKPFTQMSLTEVCKHMRELATRLQVKDEIEFLEKCEEVVANQHFDDIAEFDDFVKDEMDN